MLDVSTINEDALPMVANMALREKNCAQWTFQVETAKSRGCDLIVMGSHGRRGLRKFFLGSQTSEVLADASVPVLVVHA
jgi:hypothetical protein